MKPEYIIRIRLQQIESALKDDEKIQHTHEIPYLRGRIEALKWVLEI